MNILNMIIRMTFLGLAVLAGAGTAEANIVMRLADFQQSPSGTGSFEVLLDNNGVSSVYVAGFSFQLDLPTPSGVQYQGVSTATVSAPYVFAGVGGETFLGAGNFDFSNDAFPNTSFSASDIDWLSSAADPVNPGLPAIEVAGGTTFGLGLVTYSFLPGGPGGLVPVNFVGAGTSLSNANGDPITFTAEGGNIELQAVPEPSTFAIGLLAAGAIALAARRRRVSKADQAD